MMPAESTASDTENRLNSAFRLDKIALTVIGFILTFLFGQMWTLSAKINELDVRQAETRGQLTALSASINNLVDRGSQTAQRTEVLVQQLMDRTQRYEDFMAKGRRFTADDGDKLEKRIERLEQRK